MNRLSWDTTAPRRPGAERSPSPQPRPEDRVADDVDLNRFFRRSLRLPTF